MFIIYLRHWLLILKDSRYLDLLIAEIHKSAKNVECD